MGAHAVRQWSRERVTGGRIASAALCVGVAALVSGPLLAGCAGGTPPGAAERRSRGEQAGGAPNFALARQRAQQAAGEDDPAMAISLYREAVTAYPGLGVAWNNMGVLLMEEERYLEAAEAFAAAAEESPTDPRPLYNLGLTWDRSYYYAEALRIYLRALERDGTYLPALRGAIRAETLLGETDEETLERIRVALLREYDPRWREFFQLQRARVEEVLQAERRRSTGVRGEQRSENMRPSDEGG